MHDLTDFVTPGKMHRITLCIDNRYQYDTHKWDHAHTEFTQINWNGILGEMKLLVMDPVHIDDMQLFPRVADRSVEMRLTVANTTGKPFRGKALVTVSGNGVEVEREFPVSGDGPELRLAGELSLGDDAPPVSYTHLFRKLPHTPPQAPGTGFLFLRKRVRKCPGRMKWNHFRIKDSRPFLMFSGYLS